MRIGNSLAGSCINRLLFVIQLRFQLMFFVVLLSYFQLEINNQHSYRAEGTRNTKPSPIRFRCRQW